MWPDQFVNELCGLSFENAFNPYSDRCEVHDYFDAPQRRRALLLEILTTASNVEVDSIWVGRDLGYRGGRRTGLALTDDVHLSQHAKRWGTTVVRPTKGQAVPEKTAAIIWSILSLVSSPVFLWNVFPLHPFEAGVPFSNRAHNVKERRAGEELLDLLIGFLKPKKIIAIGNDAEKTISRLSGNLRIIKVRHPSYGGQADFIRQTQQIYKIGINKQSQLI